MVTPRSSSATTRKVGGVRFSASFGIGHPPALRIGHGVRGEDVVASHVPVVVPDVVAEALADAVEHRRVHHQPAHVAREIVGRAAEQAVRPGGDAPVRLEPACAGPRACAAAGNSWRRSRRPPRRSSRRGSPARACGHRSWRRTARRCGTPDAWSRPRPARGRHRPGGRRGCFRDIPCRSAALVSRAVIDGCVETIPDVRRMHRRPFRMAIPLGRPAALSSEPVEQGDRNADAGTDCRAADALHRRPQGRRSRRLPARSTTSSRTAARP